MQYLDWFLKKPSMKELLSAIPVKKKISVIAK